MKYFFAILITILLWTCNSKTQLVKSMVDLRDNVSEKKEATNSTFQRIEKSDEEWKAQLSDFEYFVIRDKGTERAHSGSLLNNKKKGIYTCKACNLPLFESKTKFKSGTGWPSYYAPINEDNIIEDTDYKIGYPRTEVLCARCDGHLGHVFSDGPQPTGLRYCINSVSLSFEAINKQD